MARKQSGSRKDREAADLIRRLMLREGLSPQMLVQGIKARMAAAKFSPSRMRISDDTIYLVLRTGHQPGPRIKFAISFYFGLRPGQIWSDDALFDDIGPAPTRESVAA